MSKIGGDFISDTDLLLCAFFRVGLFFFFREKRKPIFFFLVLTSLCTSGVEVLPRLNVDVGELPEVGELPVDLESKDFLTGFGLIFLFDLATVRPD
eukprot:CAMPEP_0170177346 /NCGR_PEP_ID=MMETSP0040_2-20121228/10011_1 /TAXON_ID=641309 /ORGANISM="Lotharella oceanica, Strain CCMP622" /LENGTH=95 /DNA_ID=CAMNT_0010419951 /DNA_START=559 /DNA_END=846 /DNA_ORIENTATION=-